MQVSAAVRTLRLGASTSESLRNIDKPTIAAVNGACAGPLYRAVGLVLHPESSVAGAGFSWACACNLRFASERAVFRTAFLTAGLSGDYGGTWTLPRIVGPSKARELSATLTHDSHPSSAK